MRARKILVNQMASLAVQHLDRNTSLLADQTADRLRVASAVRNAKPYLIALDAIDLKLVTDFRMSPWYSGTDLHSAIASDPIDDGGFVQELLAHSIHHHLFHRDAADVVFPHAMASKGDPFLKNVESELAFCGNRVLYVVRYNDNLPSWLSLFDDTLRTASNAGSFEIGFCTTARPTDNNEWTQEQLEGMIEVASCVFAAALDGEGYLVWEL